ncbi:hypothetical protein [Maribacter sp. 2307UL18-2]|uniref:hypothetical protein n=1 Tax=Maribacter sp. 2307UL18-2 TaxID=3386274 RepID=UPI0039BC7319
MLSEILGYLIRDHEYFQIVYLEKYDFANYIIFNIYDVVFFLYFYCLFWKLLRREKSRSFIKYGAVCYLVAAMINPFFENVFIFPQIFASTLGSIILIISIVLYLKEVRQNIIKKREILLWICAGLLIFNLFFPMILIAGRFDYPLYEKLSFRQFHYFLIAAMYICFIIGFLKMNRMKPLEDETRN